MSDGRFIPTDQGELDGAAHIIFTGIPPGAGNAVDFEFADPVTLDPGKPGHLFVGESDTLLGGFRHAVDEALLFFLAEDTVTFLSVKFPGELDDCFFTVFLYVGKDPLNDAADFLVSDSAVLAALLRYSITPPLSYCIKNFIKLSSQ